MLIGQAEYSVGPIPVGDIRIDYLRDPADRGQSTDAAPLTELLRFYTLRRLRNYCAAEYLTCWTFCDTVWNSLCIEGLLLRHGAFQACQAMEGAVLVNNGSSVQVGTAPTQGRLARPERRCKRPTDLARRG